MALVGKNMTLSAGSVRGTVSSLVQEDPLEEDTATHSSTPGWRIL